ncbi:MAG: hypothetical protein ABJO09_03530 [Hyphomicrobiales bacterium]
MSYTWKLKSFAGIFLAFLLLANISSAQMTPQSQLANRTLEVMVGFSNTGGGARFWNVFSKELRKKLPKTIIRARFNDTASGVSGTSDLFKLPKGTLAIGFVRPPEIAFAQINERAEVDFDFRDANWISGVEQDSFIMAARRELPTDPAELRKMEPQLILPVSDILATHATVGILLNAVTGIPAKIVVGFKKSDRKRALVAGDADMYTIAADAKLEPLLASGDIQSLYTIAGSSFSSVVDKTRTLETFLVPDAPKSVVSFVKSARGMGRAFFAPPSVAPKDVQALRSIFKDILEDEEFVALAASNGVPVAAVSSQDVSAQLNELLLSDEASKKQLEKAYQCGISMARGDIQNCNFGAE